MQVIIFSTAVLLASANMADASRYSKYSKYDSECKEYQSKAAVNWERYADLHDWKCEKLEHIYKKTLSEAPEDECKIKYGSYVEYHYNKLDKECEVEPDSNCKEYQVQAAKYWDESADYFDYDCDKIEHIYKKALSEGPTDECKTKYGSYIEWHYNELDDKCNDESSCKKYQGEAAQYWKEAADNYHWKCEKLEHIYKKALSYAPEYSCKTDYESYVEWHYNELDKKCDW